MASTSDFFEVDLNKVELPDLEPNWQHSHGYSRQQMEQWVAELQEIQRLSQEEGYKPSDFEKMRADSNPAVRALGQTHHQFYGNPKINQDCVVLEWRKDHYEITNGRHRVWLAKQQGVRSLPALVSAPDTPTLARLKEEGARANEASRRRFPWDRGTDPQRPDTPTRER